MKKAAKITVSILLVLAFMLASATAAFCFIKDSVYLYDLEWYKLINPKEVTLKECMPWDYYDKVPDGLSYEGISAPSIETLLNKCSAKCVARVTFRERITNKSINKRAEFVFDVNEVILGEYSDSTVSIGYPREYASYYSSIDHLFNYYGVGYEKGEEYLLFFMTDDYGNAYPYGSTFDSRDGNYKLTGDYCQNIHIIKLDGDYPYIELYPNPVRYDATYFGAETKYVTKDEFVQLVIQAT